MAEMAAGFFASLTKIILSLAGSILAFLMLPATRKVSLIVSGCLFSVVAGYTSHKLFEYYQISDAVGQVISVAIGFFGLAILEVFAKLNMAIMADEKLVKATLDRLEKWIRG